MMIKCKIAKGKKIKINAAGNIHELCVEICTLISATYLSINKKNPEAATAFKNELIGTLFGPGSPVWTGKDPNSQPLPEGHCDYPVDKTKDAAKM